MSLPESSPRLNYTTPIQLELTDSDGVSSELEQEIRILEEFESEVAGRLGISPKDIDSVMILFKVKESFYHDADYPGIVQKLYKLRSLRQQYSCMRNKLPVHLEVCHSPSGSPHRVDASRFWAILIGINEYASYPLQGCVPDVQLMEKYLTEDLGVPNNRIQLLLGSKEHLSPEDPLNPSRSHIVSTLLSLITNPKIASGDNIIIYYSGHGSYYPDDTEENEEPEYIGAFCPIDHDTLDSDGQPVPDISNREFNSILSLICKAKGHCVTVILDCCHSGGVSRGIPEPGSRTSPPMSRATLRDMLVVGHNNLRHHEGYHSILTDDWHSDMDSHVLLAACKGHQFAKAKKLRREDGSFAGYIGIFTDSLVRVLRSGYYRKDTTYAGLVQYCDKSSHQTPVVAGKYKNSHLWFQD